MGPCHSTNTGQRYVVYDRKTELRHNLSTLARAGLSPESEGVCRLINPPVNYDTRHEHLTDLGTVYDNTGRITRWTVTGTSLTLDTHRLYDTQCG